MKSWDERGPELTTCASPLYPGTNDRATCYKPIGPDSDSMYFCSMECQARWGRSQDIDRLTDPV